MNLLLHPPTYATPHRRRRTSWSRVIRWLTVGLSLATLGLGLFARTDSGKRAIADVIERAVSSAIPGRLMIGRIETFGWGEPVVDDLRFLHPDGSLILLAKRATIDLDLGALLHGELAFHHASVDGGYLLVAAQPDGRTGLEATFDDGQPSAPEDRDDYLHMRLRSIRVNDMTTVFRPSPDQTFRLRDVRGFVAVTHLETKGARVRLDRITGKLETPQFLGEHLSITNADGWVRGKEVHVLDLDLETTLGAGNLDGHLAYYDRKETPVELELDPKSGATPYAAALAIEARSWFTDTIDVAVR